MRERIDTTKGILRPDRGRGRYRVERYVPADDLKPFIERHWIVRWRLPAGESFEQELLAHPCVNMVLERGLSGVFGVATGRSSRLLQGEGVAFGVKFRPGGFYPFWRAPVCRLTDRAVGLREAFGAAAASLEEAVLARSGDDEAMIGAVEAFLRSLNPAVDSRLAELNRIVEAIAEDRRITRVDQLAERFGLSERTLQRLFQQRVGVGPKWVIARFRLHEAAEQIARRRRVDWAALALELGYADQAHLIHDFKATVGVTPAAYAKELEESAESRL